MRSRTELARCRPSAGSACARLWPLRSRGASLARLMHARPAAEPVSAARCRLGRRRRPSLVGFGLAAASGGERGGPALAPGGTLGGSQAGARASVSARRRPVAERARLCCRCGRPRGAEAAAGLDWRPIAAMPGQSSSPSGGRRLGREGRSAFSRSRSTAAPAGRCRAGCGSMLYAQAGIVGLKSRDGFVDGSARVARAARPGRGRRRRLGRGPARRRPARRRTEPVVRALPVAGAPSARRPTGASASPATPRPRSGPALTLAADF